MPDRATGKMKMDKSDKDKSAFMTYDEVYMYSRMRFRWKNGPGIFRRAMVVILAAVKLQYVCVYIDSITLSSISQEDHERHVDTVMKMIKNLGMTLKPNKCQLFSDAIDYL